MWFGQGTICITTSCGISVLFSPFVTNWKNGVIVWRVSRHQVTTYSHFSAPSITYKHLKDHCEVRGRSLKEGQLNGLFPHECPHISHGIEESDVHYNIFCELDLWRKRLHAVMKPNQGNLDTKVMWETASANRPKCTHCCHGRV